MALLNNFKKLIMATSFNIEKYRYTPNNGESIPVPTTKEVAFMEIDNATPLATLTFQLPPSPDDMQIFMVSVRSAITQVIFTANGRPIRSMVASLKAGAVIGWIYGSESGAWFSYLPAPSEPYTIAVQALTSSPADGATVYFGNMPKAPTTTAGANKIYIRDTCVIKRAEIYTFSGTAGTGEAWSLYIRKNNATDTLIQTVSLATNERIFSNTNLNISMVAGDYIELKWVNPTWATNPLTTIAGGYLYIE